MTASRQQIGFVLLMLAGLVIAGLCYYKTTRVYQPVDVKQSQLTQTRPALLFELYDQHKPSRSVRLVSYVSRHRIILIFFNGKVGLYNDDLLKPFRNHAAKLKAAGTIVIGISDALPQTNRQQIEQHRQNLPDAESKNNYRFPFPLLSDPGYEVHRLYGRFDEHQGVPTQGVFVISRAGQIEWSQSAPKPYPSEHEQILKLIEQK